MHVATASSQEHQARANGPWFKRWDAARRAPVRPELVPPAAQEARGLQRAAQRGLPHVRLHMRQHHGAAAGDADLPQQPRRLWPQRRRVLQFAGCAG